MDTKNITMTVIGLAVAVLLVAGFMIPVLSSAIGGSGGDDGETTYINEGTLYYKAPVEGETHSIELIDTRNEGGGSGILTVEYDDTELISVPYQEYLYADERPATVNIPILISDGETDMGGMTLRVLTQIVVFIVYGYYMDEYDYSIYGYGPNVGYTQYTNTYFDGVSYGGAVSSLDLGGNSTTILIEDDTYTIDGSDTYTPGLSMHLCNDGDLVYSETPVFSEESDVTMMYFDEQKRYASPADWEAYQMYAGYTGRITDMSTDGMVVLEGDFGSDIESVDSVDARTSDYRGVLRLDGIDITATYDDDSERTFTATSLIVPVEVEVSGSGGGSGGVDGPLGTMIMVIPLLTVIGLIISAVAVFRKG